MDLNKADMLQLLSYLEGELQAREVTIAALQVMLCIFSNLNCFGSNVNKIYLF